MARSRILTLMIAAAACHRPAPRPVATAPETATVARIYFWRARPGKLAEYSRYVTDSAEPIDQEARRRGAFLTITTSVDTNGAGPWTHMRVFTLRDTVQLAGLSAALDQAGVTVEPDSGQRRARNAYAAGLRDFVGQATVDLEHGRLAYVPLPGYGAAPVREGTLISAGGVRLFYRLVGSGGDTLVFVHGGPGTGMREGYDFERLVALGHALLMYDQRGSGMSELVSDSARLGIADHVADLDAVIRHFRIAKAKLIGLSWGAAIAAQWAADHGDAVDRVAFVSPISPTKAFITARFAHLDSTSGRPDAGGLAARLRDAALPVPDSLAQRRCRAQRTGLYRHGGPHAVSPRGDPCDYPASVLRNRARVASIGLASLGADYDLRPVLHRVHAPAIVVEGELTNVPLDATRAFADALSNGRLVLVPEAGHQSWLDYPDAFFPIVDRFMTDIKPW